MQEIDHLMTITTSGVKTYKSAVEALAERFREWLNTPVGSVWGNPGWGNILDEFRHEPTDLSHVQVAIENRLLAKLKIDLPEIGVQSITATEIEMDYIQVVINIPEGTLTVVTSTDSDANNSTVTTSTVSA